MDNQLELRSRLEEMMKKSPTSLKDIARRMGMNYMVFLNFWFGRKKTSTKNLIIIENFIQLNLEK